MILDAAAGVIVQSLGATSELESLPEFSVVESPNK